MNLLTNIFLNRIQKYQLLQNKKNNRQRTVWQSGLTLIELAIVILVLGVIMSIVYANLNPGDALAKTKKLQVRAMATTLEAKWQQYELENEILSDNASLDVLTQSSESWRGVKEEQVLDPWKNFYFVCTDNNGTRQICSYGADNTPGGRGQNSDFHLTNQSTWPSWLKSAKKK